MTTPPRIFSRARRIAVRERRRRLQRRPDAPDYLIADMVEDVLERLAFLRHEPRNALIIGDWRGTLACALGATGCRVMRADPTPGPEEIAIDEEQPFPFGGFDFIASLGTLDTVNDLPGALVHIRRALAPGGLMIASFCGAGSLSVLRSAMLASAPDRPAARMHPLVDVRAGGQLLQRTGFARPVVDARSLRVRFGSMASCVADLRSQGLGNVLANPGPALTRDAVRAASASFQSAADQDGRMTESLEIITLSAWKD